MTSFSFLKHHNKEAGFSETCLLQQLDFSLRMLNLQQSESANAVLGLAEQAGQRFGPNVKDKTWMEGKGRITALKYFDSYLGGKKTPFIYQFS